MAEYIKRFCVALAVAICISLLFLGANATNAESNSNDIELTDFLWPAEGVLTDTFGTRNGKHYGIDIAAKIGTPVFASESGKVVKSYFSRSYGNVIFIQHDNNMETVYAHLHKRLVAEGDIVKKGEKIGEVGNTGRSTGSHLHFEVHYGQWDIHKTTAINPLLVLNVPNNQKLADDASEKESQVSEANSKYEQVKRKIIKVKKGDTLWGFSQKYNVPVKDIMKWNNLDSSLIYIDQELTIYLHQKM